MEECRHKLSFKLLVEVCSVIQDTGFTGSAEDYTRIYYGKPFSELTVCEVEMIVRTLGTKPGCLYEGSLKDLEPVQQEPDNEEAPAP